MNRVKFIYNPQSGESTIVTDLDTVIMIHQKYGYEIVPYRIGPGYDMCGAFESLDETFKYILIAGGDGTVDSVVNCMKERGIDLPIGIIPVGTANDFAKYIGMPEDVDAACEQILNSDVEEIDVGRINDKYFINVASTGLFTDISQKTDLNLKNTIGKLAYYLKGLEQVPNFRNLKVKVISGEDTFDGDMYLMLVFNGQTAGNLNFAYKAEVTDGLLDVIIFKAVMFVDLIPIIIDMIKGEHLEHENGIIYFKTNRIRIECDEDIVTDIDGERGPDFPLDIECIKGGIKVMGALLQ
ncbi:MAG: YegS/Rv2252/BmrU family lipid kinase [Clostridiaceae bacterium]